MADEAKRGRPTEHTLELAAEICRRLAEGLSLREICRDEGFPPESTVRQWVVDDREGFAAQYARAREAGYQRLADEVLEISDDGSNDWLERQDEEAKRTYLLNGEHVQRSRLRVDTRKWLLSKVLPKIYGDRIINEHGGIGGGPIQTEDVNDSDRVKAFTAFLAKTGAAK